MFLKVQSTHNHYHNDDDDDVNDDDDEDDEDGLTMVTVMMVIMTTMMVLCVRDGYAFAAQAKNRGSVGEHQVAGTSFRRRSA